jgi:pimeloyl-ACP methyl ester carboxylesterase
MGDCVFFVRDAAWLACRDFGGEGDPVVLLHGLAGHAEEWRSTVTWLTAEARVWALDARGHGMSERRPGDVSHRARVDDVAFVLERLELDAVVLVGQSLGGLTALSFAAENSERVRGLVLVEASPSNGGDVRAMAEEVGEALRRWPVPFRSRESALEFFAERFGSPLVAEAWTAGLQETADGWRPRFDVDVMVETLVKVLGEPTWPDWEQIPCPTLIVRGEKGTLTENTAAEMVKRQPNSKAAVVPAAGHDLHLEQPASWRAVLTRFLHQLG